MIRQGQSAYLRRALLNQVYGAQAYTPAGTLYLALFSTRHGTDGSGGTELSGGGYARKAVTNNTTSFPDAVDHELENGTEIAFAAATGDWSRAVAFAWYDQASGGNQLHFGELLGEPVAVTVNAGTDVLTTDSAHGLADGTRVKLYNRDGGLPGGLTEAATYYVRDAGSTTLKLAATSGGAAVDLTSAGEGAHYLAEDRSKLVESGDIARFAIGALKIREGREMVDNAQAKRFINELLRPLCDDGQRTFRAALHVPQDWSAKAIGELVPDTSEVINDVVNGEPGEDGRTPLTGEEVHALVEGWQRLVAYLAVNEQAFLQLVNKAAVNGAPRV